MILKNLANLIKVKTITTILLTLTFCYLSLTGIIAAELFMTIFSMVIAFYFGTQHEKKDNELNN
jgi:hypothetical protein